MNRQNKNKLIDKENKFMVGKWKGGRGMGKKVKRLRTIIVSYNNSHKDVKCSIGNVVGNMVIATYCVGWILDLSR